jgi:hypothetical protein
MPIAYDSWRSIRWTMHRFPFAGIKASSALQRNPVADHHGVIEKKVSSHLARGVWVMRTPSERDQLHSFLPLIASPAQACVANPS